MSDFFPDEIQTESISGYTKFVSGTPTRLRILAKPLFLWETWIEEDGKRAPKRFALDAKIPVSEVGADGIKQTMFCKVYNYETKSVQVMSVYQKQILKPLKKATLNPKYGNPTGYDIIIEREGEGMQTRYSLTADPQETMSKEVKEADEKQGVDLEAMLINADPFMNKTK